MIRMMIVGKTEEKTILTSQLKTLIWKDDTEEGVVLE